MIGETIAHYQVRAELSEGGTDAVYRAEDLTLCHPERSRGICGSLNQRQLSTEATALPFVIPSEVEEGGSPLIYEGGGALQRSGKIPSYQQAL